MKRWAVILALCGLVGAGARGESLTGPDWIAKEDAPSVRHANDEIVFPCPFGPDEDRFYWDQEVSLDLSGISSFELDLSCSRPQAVRTLSIYFGSGEGWYHWSGPPPGPGGARLTLVKSTFDVEGTPSGWDRIDRVRFSPWKGEPEAATFALKSLTARRDKILIVQGTASAASTSEKALARQSAARVSRWMTDLGMEHGGVDDVAVISGALKGAEIAILSYNPQPPPEEIAQLKRFIGRGGKLIVFGSSSRALARLMGLELGQYTVSNEPGRWAAMRFDDPQSWRVPDRVFETAWSLIPARPAEPGASVIARWESANGRMTQDPACLASPQGFWFCHAPRGDDPQGKQAMLLALLGRHHPELWRDAARHALLTAGRIGPYPGLPTAFAAIRKKVPKARRRRAERLLDETAIAHRRLTAAFAAGDYRKVMRDRGRVGASLARAYALTAPASAHEFRGVWDHDGTGLYPGDWARTCESLAALGITAVLPNLAWGGLAHYPSRVLPGSNTLRLHGDQARQSVDAAHARGLEVHVWKVCWNLSNAPADFRDRLRGENRLQRTSAGVARDWLCPSHPANLRLEVDALKELAANYPIDGIHLDYVRYPSADTCFCGGCRKRFETATGKPVAAWPDDVLKGAVRYEAFTDWRADQITKLVRAVHREVRAVRPGIRLSAAVFRNYPSCRESVGQDWPLWLREGYLDFVCPMNYTDNFAGFQGTTRRQMAIADEPQRIVPGLGVLSGESQLGPEETAAQVVASRELGAGGFVFFDLSRTLVDNILPCLGLPPARRGR